jgi:glutathione S-transferase
MITVYGQAASRATRPLWLLEELGVPYRHVPTNLLNGEAKAPDYLKLNPAGKVPTVVDGSLTLTESLAINHYIAETYDTSGKLLPADRNARAKCLQWTLWAATELEPLGVAIVRELLYKPDGKSDPKVLEGLAERAKLVLRIPELALTQTPYLLGNAFTLADLNVAVVLEYLFRCKYDLSPWPKVAAWGKTCLDRPAHQKIMAMKIAPK